MPPPGFRVRARRVAFTPAPRQSGEGAAAVAPASSKARAYRAAIREFLAAKDRLALHEEQVRGSLLEDL